MWLSCMFAFATSYLTITAILTTAPAATAVVDVASATVSQMLKKEAMQIANMLMATFCGVVSVSDQTNNRMVKC